MIEDLIAMIREWPKAAVALSAFFSAGLSVGSYAIYAEQCHAQTRENQKTIEQLVEFQREVVNEKEADLKAKRQVEQAILQLCLSGKLKDKAECAKVGVEIHE